MSPLFDKKIVIVTPWFGAFAGGAESLARGLAREFTRRGVLTNVFTTCSNSPYDDWWSDRHQPGWQEVEGIRVRRFATDKLAARHRAAAAKLQKQEPLTPDDEDDFFHYGLNSEDLVAALAELIDEEHEVLALPYFYGLTHSAVNSYPGKISIIPCFHDEPQFYWRPTEKLLANAKHIFFNSHEEKQMAIRFYGKRVGRRIVEAEVTGVGVELKSADPQPGVQLSLPPKYFVYTGRKEAGKNVPLLCDWFAAYAEATQTEAKLVFIGGGNPHLPPSNAFFVDLGFVSEAAKREILQRAIAVINLSQNESFSISIMEGWLAGRPAVVHGDCDVTSGHARRSHGGLFPATAGEFASCLSLLEKNPEVTAGLGRNGCEYVSSQFSYDAVLSRFMTRLFADSCEAHEPVMSS